MPVPFVLDEELDLVYLAPHEAVTTHEFLACVNAYARKPAFHPKIDVLVDLRGMTALNLGDDAAVSQIADVIRETRAGETDYRVGCIVRTDTEETFFALGGDVLYLAGDAKPFYSLPEALDWLDRPGAEARIERLRQELTDGNA